jgi:hypothetical protein
LCEVLPVDDLTDCVRERFAYAKAYRDQHAALCPEQPEDPATWGYTLWQFALGDRRCARRYLRSRFGYDPRRPDRRPHRRARTDYERGHFAYALTRYLTWSACLGRVEVLCRGATERGVAPPWHQIGLLLAHTLRLQPALAAGLIVDTPAGSTNDALRLFGSLSLAGWTATQIQQLPGSRLWAALVSAAGGDASPGARRRAMLTRLPGAVEVAWAQFQWDEPLVHFPGTPPSRTFVSRVYAALVDGQAAEDEDTARDPERVSAGAAPAAPDPLQELLEHEALADVIAEAGLTPLEQEAWLLDWAGYTDAEIATQQHVKPGTIWARLSDAREKIAKTLARRRDQDSA